MVDRNAPQALPRAKPSYETRDEQQMRDMVSQQLDQILRRTQELRDALDTLTSDVGDLDFLVPANNLDDVDDPAAALANLGGVAKATSSTDGYLALFGNTTGDLLKTPPTRVHLIDSSGRIIAGHTAALTVGASMPPAQFYAGGASGIVLGRFSADAADPNIRFLKSRATTPGNFSAALTGDGVGNIRWFVDNGSNYNAAVANIVARLTGTVSATATPGVLDFQTTPAGAITASSRMLLENGLRSNGVTGGDKGAGTLNFAELYEANIRALTTATGVSSINIQAWTSGTNTYTPTTGMKFCIAIGTGAGGGGGGVNGQASGAEIASGGAAGATSIGLYTAATIGASKTVVVGAGGAAGTTSGTDGSAGADTTISGGLMTATGGNGGIGNTASNTAAPPSATAAGSGGIVNLPGAPGSTGTAGVNNTFGMGGAGGASFWGGGAPANGPNTAGATATVPGAGGSSGNAYGSATARAGGVGAPGLMIIFEFI